MPHTKVMHPERRVPTARATLVALLAAAGLHGVGIAVISAQGCDGNDSTAAAAPVAMPLVAAPAVVGRTARVALVDLDTTQIPAAPLETMLGPANQAAFDEQHPNPAAGIDTAGHRAAARGGGDVGGSETETGRRDREELRQQTWTNPDRYRLARTRSGRRVRSPEAITRTPRPGWDERTRKRRLARAGEAKASRGLETGSGSSATSASKASPKWEDSDPFFDAPAAKRVAQRQTGTTRAKSARLHTDPGAAATEAHRRGRLVDRRTASAASNETKPMPLELTKPRSGGGARGSGVAGARRGPGMAPRGGITRGGSAGTSHQVRRGRGQLAVRAWRYNPYFRRMYKRVDRLVKFPKKLALALEQGQLVARFRLYPDGRIGAVSLSKSSGFRQFDKVVLRAIRRAAPFGTVPAAILKGRTSVTVSAPYVFSNPLIR